MSNLNKVQIIGRNGRDPEIRYLPDGKAVASLAVAVSEKWKDKQGNPQESTEWFNVSLFGRLAEIAGEYVRKGDLIYLEGKQKTDKWTDQQGVEKYTTKMIANQMQMLGGKRDDNRSQGGNQQNQRPQGASNSQGYQQQGNQGQQNQNLNPNGTPKSPAQMQGKAPMAEPDFDFDSDIPFAPVGLQYRSLLNCI